MAASTGREPEAPLEDAVAAYAAPERAALDWSQCAAVELVPGKMSGAWVLKNTRMPVAMIFESLERGARLDDIMEWYDGLERDQVKAVIEFAARSLDMPLRLADAGPVRPVDTRSASSVPRRPQRQD